MNIVFDMFNCGLGNNGGTRTILKSQQTLEALGHRCDIYASIDNFTWFKHKQVISYIPPDTDIIIATACNTVLSTANSNVPIKAWWIRAHETWAMPEEQLVRLYKLNNIINLVNSIGLMNMLASSGIASDVIYQGLDFDLWSDTNLRPKSKIRIGCLHTVQPRKRWIDFVALSAMLGADDYEYVGIGNALPKNAPFLTDFKLNASTEELKDLYSSCHIWFAPTDSEGLHNPPMEAALCGCLILCSDSPLNGMISDYANRKTAMIYPAGKIDKAVELVKKPEWQKIDTMRKSIETWIGTREDNMKNLIEILQ